MKNPSAYLALAALVLVPLTVAAQTTPAHTPPKAIGSGPVRHKTAPVSAGVTLPKNIPVVPGLPKSLYALRYIDMKLGTGAAAEPGWIYTVHYTGWLYDGTKFDSSVDRGTPFDFPQGRHGVIPGWDTGFDGMKVGGKRRLFIPYQLAYGEQGRSAIPPKANLIFDIELISQRDPVAARPAPPVPPTPAPEQPAPPTPPPAEATPPANQSATPPAPKPE